MVVCLLIAGLVLAGTMIGGVKAITHETREEKEMRLLKERVNKERLEKELRDLIEIK